MRLLVFISLGVCLMFHHYLYDVNDGTMEDKLLGNLVSKYN